MDEAEPMARWPFEGPDKKRVMFYLGFIHPFNDKALLVSLSLNVMTIGT